MTNRQRFFINGIFLTAVGLAVRSVSIGFNAYISQAIGAEGIGLFTLIGTVYAFAVTFATSGISLTVTRLVSAAKGEGKETDVGAIMHSAVLYALLFSSFAGAVLFLGAPYFAREVLSDPRTLAPLRVLSLSLIPIAMSSVFSGYFIGVKRVGLNATVQISAQVLKIALTLTLLTRYKGGDVGRGILALATSMTLTELSVFVLSLLEYLWDKRKRAKGSSAGGKFSNVLSMAGPLAISAYIRSALLSLEHILIPKRLKDSGESHSSALSAYGVLHGMALPMLLYPMSPLSSFAGLIVPEFSESMARGETGRLRRIASEALNATLAYSVSAAVLVSLFSEELGYVVYSSYDAGHYLSVMALVIPIMYLDHVTDSMLKGIGEHVYAMWVNVTDSILSIVLVWFLIPRMGIVGYAVVIVVMEGYNFSLSAWRLRKRIRFKINLVEFLLLPLFSAFLAAYVSKKAFVFAGALDSLGWLTLKIAFAVCLFLAFYITSREGLSKARLILKTKRA